MPQDPDTTKKEFERILSSDNHPQMNIYENKFIIISDIHLGNGGGADNFVHNEKILFDCLDYYKNNRFKLILLGDIEDFWQTNPDAARKRYYCSIYNKMREFGDENIFRIFGNHDIEWGKKSSDGKKDPAFNDGRGFGSASEAIKLIDNQGNTIIVLFHGHQGSIESEKFKKFAKPLMWLYGKLIEPILELLHLSNLSSEPNTKIDNNYEQVYYENALKQKVMVIVGHSHYAIFASRCYADTLQKQINDLKLQIQKSVDVHEKENLLKKVGLISTELKSEKARKREITPTDPNRDPKPCYFNTGCCLYTYGITCIELKDDTIKLIKWGDGGKTEDYGNGKISDFYNTLKI